MAEVVNVIVSIPLTVAVPRISSVAVIVIVSLSYGSVSTIDVPEIKVELVALITSFTPVKPGFSTSATTTIEFEVIEAVEVSSVVVVLDVSVVLDVLLPQLESIIAIKG